MDIATFDLDTFNRENPVLPGFTCVETRDTEYERVPAPSLGLLGWIADKCRSGGWIDRTYIGMSGSATDEGGEHQWDYTPLVAVDDASAVVLSQALLPELNSCGFGWAWHCLNTLLSSGRVGDSGWSRDGIIDLTTLPEPPTHCQATSNDERWSRQAQEEHGTPYSTDEQVLGAKVSDALQWAYAHEAADERLARVERLESYISEAGFMFYDLACRGLWFDAQQYAKRLKRTADGIRLRCNRGLELAKVSGKRQSLGHPDWKGLYLTRAQKEYLLNLVSGAFHAVKARPVAPTS